MAQPGTVDPGFNPNAGSWLYTTVAQADGKVLLGGTFGTVGGVPRNYLARVNPDGSLDRGFNPNPDHNVRCVVVQGDGKILIAGFFTAINGVARNSLARLNADGTLDTGFDPNLVGGVVSMAVQPDGRILLVGSFSNVGGLARGNIARLNADGTPDAGFSPTTNSTVYTAAVEADGKVLIGGDFTTVSGQAHNRIARLNPDGTLDTSFNPNSMNSVHSLAVQTDGKIIIGGDFITINGVTRNHIARLNPDGTLDTDFNPNASEWITSMALQADGKIVVGGVFTTMGGAPRNRIARLNGDGTLDTGFNPNANSFVDSVALQGDGKVVLGGTFTTLAGVVRNYIARLENDAATQNLTVPSPSRVEWLRGGAAPESQWATFELTTDGGATYSTLGAGTRISGGWELTGLSLPASGHIRARALPTAGYQNGSSSVLETLAPFGGVTSAPEIAIRGNGIDIANGSSTPALVDGTDFSSANIAGDTVVRTFTVRNLGTATLTLASATLSGANAEDFSVSSQPYSSLAPGGTTTFDVTFNPSATGPRAAALELVNDDGDEGPFSFEIRGTGAVSSNADLTALSLSAGTLAPGFDALTLSYTASVASSYASILVVPTTASPHASIQARVNGGAYQAVTSGSPSETLALNVGSNLVELLVTAQDEVTVRTYTVTVTRGVPAPGDVDPSFDANLFGFGLPGTIYSTAVQLDGRILVGGSYQYFAGVHRCCIARLNADGTRDASFPSSDPNDSVLSIAIQPDGKILIEGRFTYVGGVPRNGMARLNSDGSLDMSFNPDVNNWVFATALQVDGKIVIGGYFTAVGGLPRNYSARLNADGTLDTGFDPNADGFVQNLAVATDGTILMGGTFFTVGGLEHWGVARLNSDGAPDPDFQAAASGGVSSITIQSDGRILLGGSFVDVNWIPRQNLARLNADGTLDPTFDPGVNGGIHTMAVQTDGRILIGGYFTSVGGTERAYFARLGADGTLDTTFNPEVDRDAYSMSIQADGRILVGGEGVSFRRIVRLLNNAATQTLGVPDSSRIEWVRGGSSPESQQVTFDLSVDGGVVYTPLGTGTRISGGWELTGLSLPATGQIRARARTTGGQYNGSGGLVETVTLLGGGGPSSNATLVGLSLSQGTLAPAFGSLTLDYAASVRFNVSTLAVTPTAADVNATIQARVNGGPYQSVASGNPSAALALNVGVNPVDLLVTAQDGITTTVYTVTLTRAPIAPGDADPGFTPGANNAVISMAVQADGRILVGGSFTIVGGGARNHIARLKADGTLDPDFNPDADGIVNTVAAQADGKILIGGAFTTVGGVVRNYIARLNADGSVDPGFNPDASYFINTVAVQTDGKILVGGDFATVGGVVHYGIARLNSDGSLDTTFNPVLNGSVRTIALQGDGTIVLGGFFTTVGGVGRNFLARLNGDGTLDLGFNPDANSAVYSTAVQTDGKVLVGGTFTTVGGVARSYFARLNGDGTLDTGLDTDANNIVWSTALQTDGKIVMGGTFTAVGGTAHNHIARLNADGTVDTGFDASTANIAMGAFGDVYSTAVQADGRILLGGFFDTVSGVSRDNVARLENGAATQSLTVPSTSRVEWLRGGTSPESQQVTFELSTDGGAVYTPLGAGARISGGWELTGLSLPPSGHLRARARTNGGIYSGSSGVAEAVTALPPEIVVTGNDIEIADGDTTPTLSDHTDFSAANIIGGSVARTFTVTNIGTAALTLGEVAIGGSHAADFVVTAQPAPSVSGGNSTTFQVAFDPSALGLRSATLSFANNDSDENPFNFDIQGTGTCSAIALGGLANGILNAAYSGAATASGGVGPYAYAVTSGSLPSGLALVASGAGAGSVSGTPDATGTFTFEITATDTASGGACAGVRSYTLVIGSPIAGSDLVIREFRLRGPAGPEDEYAEIMNRTAGAVTIAATDGTAGFGIVSESAGLLATIPNGTVIPGGGSYLAVNSTSLTGYSLSNYGGAGAAGPDASWATDLPDNRGLGLFNSSSTFEVSNRLDAVGFSGSTAPYREGTGLSPAAGITASGQWVFVRKAPHPLGVVQDTGNNASDFLLVSTDAGIYSVQSALGTPGPQGLLSSRRVTLPVALADPEVSTNSAPNRIQVGNYHYFRRKITNDTGAAITKLRYRIADLSTLFGVGYSPGVQADWRGIGTTDATITLLDATTPTAKGLTLEAPTIPYPVFLKGGGYNASFVVDLADLGGSLANGASIYLNIGFRNVKGGNFYFVLVPEVLP